MNFTFKFITFKNPSAGYIAIHTAECNHLAKHGGQPKDASYEYSGFMSLDSARLYANATGLEVKECTTCNPA